MSIKVKIPKRKNGSPTGKGLLAHDPVIRFALAVFIILSVGVCGWFSYYYIKYDRIIDQRFKGSDGIVRAAGFGGLADGDE